MAVQAQYPSNIVLTDFRKRLRSEVTDELSIKENLIHLYSAGLNSLPQLHGSASCNVDANSNMQLPVASKKPREDVNFVSGNFDQTNFIPVGAGLDTRNVVNPLIGFQQTAPHSCVNTVQFPPGLSTQTSVQVPNKESVFNPLPSSVNKINANANANGSGSEFQLLYTKQKNDIEQLVALHGQRLKQALEEKRQAQTRALLSFVNQSLSARLREKDLEIEKLNRRNQELEDHVKQLVLESRLWQNVARNSEVMVTSLRSNLEQVVALSREQSKEGCGETDADDAESCIHGNDDDAHASISRDHYDNGNQRKCKSCRKNNVCVLLLPCRHLCLCKDCDTWTKSCPICGSAKNASLQVFLD